MPRRSSAKLALSLGAAAFLVLDGVHAACADAGHAWSDAFGLPLFDSEVFCATRWHGSVVVGGSFEYVGRTRAHRVARWDGAQWQPIGSGVDGLVTCCTTLGDTLVLGGVLATADGVGRVGVVRWTGSQWQPMGAGLDGLPLRLITMHDTLVAVGNFNRSGDTLVRNAAWWDGTAWRPFGRGLSAPARAAAVYRGKLFVAGWFDSAGTVPAQGLASWDGTDWSAVPWDASQFGQIHALASAHGHLYAGGFFPTIGTIPAQGLASWNGSAWSVLPGGHQLPTTALALRGDSLYVATALDTIVIWDGIVFDASPAHMRGARIQDLFGDSVGVVAAGGIGIRDQAAGATVNASVLATEGGAWHPFMAWDPQMHGFSPARAPVTGLVRYRSQIVAAGQFTAAGDGGTWRPLAGLASWDGAHWQPLPGWTPAGNGVLALAARDDTLYTLGWFPDEQLGARPGYRFDGWSWSALDTLGAAIGAAAVYRGALYVTTGPWPSSGRSGSGGVWRLEGDHWVQVGTTSGGGPNVGPITLAVYADQLILGGQFLQVDGVPAVGVAAWDGAHWHALGNGLPQGPSSITVGALAVHDGELYAASSLYERSAVARWDGTDWVPTGELTGAVLSLASFGGRLYASGGDLRSGQKVLYGLAAWNGVRWTEVDGGLDGSVRTLLADGNRLWVGGDFTHVGDLPSYGIAAWDSVSATSGAAPVMLSAGVPNPFVNGVDFSYELAAGGPVSITVTDVAGRHVATLEADVRPPGVHVVRWDGRADGGRRLPAGIYFVRITRPDGRTATQKTVLLH